MTDQKKIAELEQKLTQLDKEYGDLGAYKEYGQVIKEVLGLFKELDLSGNGSEMEKKISGLVQEVKKYDHQVGRLKTELAQQKNDYSNEIRLTNNHLEELIDDFKHLKNIVETQEKYENPMTDFEDGLLWIQLGDYPHFYDFKSKDYDSASRFNHIEVEINDGENPVFLITNSVSYEHPTHGTMYTTGVCKKKLLGGNYTIKSTVGEQTIKKNVTIDGNVNLYIEFSEK
jgi:hypothetical protein